MGARGTKRRRSDGQIASGKSKVGKSPRLVPAVAADEIGLGYSVLTMMLDERGNPSPETEVARWDEAYSAAQTDLRQTFGTRIGDAVLWRATFLHALVGWDEFRSWHTAEELPTDAMLGVAASISTSGADKAFDVHRFEDILESLDEAGTRSAASGMPRP